MAWCLVKAQGQIYLYLTNSRYVLSCFWTNKRLSLVVADMFWIIVSLISLAPNIRAAPERPHIVLILADDVVS
jgi:hypothetical protein